MLAERSPRGTEFCVLFGAYRSYGVRERFRPTSSKKACSISTIFLSALQLPQSIWQGHFWQFGQNHVLRPAWRTFWILVPHCRHGSPALP